MRKPLMLVMVILFVLVLFSIPGLAEFEKPNHWFIKPIQKLWTAVLDLQSQINAQNTENEALKSMLDDLKAQNEALQSELANAIDAISELQSQLVTAQNDIANFQAIGDRVLEIEGNTVLELDGYLSLNHNGDISTALFSGVNVQVVNGMGATETTNKLGNLIVGHNEPRGYGDVRNGSHNIVVGSGHSCYSYGGLVAGNSNTISGHYSSVSGGRSNLAHGHYSSVSGGDHNEASAYYSSVSGGQDNDARGDRSSVIGGRNNIASDDYCSISGGWNNTTTTSYSSVVGNSGYVYVGATAVH